MRKAMVVAMVAAMVGMAAPAHAQPALNLAEHWAVRELPDPVAGTNSVFWWSSYDAATYRGSAHSAAFYTSFMDNGLWRVDAFVTDNFVRRSGWIDQWSLTGVTPDGAEHTVTWGGLYMTGRGVDDYWRSIYVPAYWLPTSVTVTATYDEADRYRPEWEWNAEMHGTLTDGIIAPEPATIALTATGLLALGGLAVRRRRRT